MEKAIIVGQTVRVDGTGYRVMGEAADGRWLISKLNPCNGEPRKNAKPVPMRESRMKVYNDVTGEWN